MQERDADAHAKLLELAPRMWRDVARVPVARQLGLLRTLADVIAQLGWRVADLVAPAFFLFFF